MADRPLAGCAVAVTRPAHQADELCRALERAGATALRFPTIAIRPLPPPRVAGTAYDVIVYTSTNAVANAGPLLALRGAVHAIGGATDAALRARGIEPAARASVHGSESLAERLAAVEVLSERAAPGEGKRILIVCGAEGRELLRERWSGSGHAVEVAEVYERVMPDADPAPLEDAWRRHALQAITVTSNATLANLDRMLTPYGRERLRDTQLVVASTRAVRLARELGIKPQPLVAAGAGSAELVGALTAWWRDARPPH